MATEEPVEILRVTIGIVGTIEGLKPQQFSCDESRESFDLRLGVQFITGLLARHEGIESNTDVGLFQHNLNEL